MKRTFILGTLALIALVAAASYYITYIKEDSANKTIAPVKLPSVEVKTLHKEKVKVWSEFSGRLQAVDSAEIRPQVSGRIVDVRFEDGELVKEGDVLFVIDPRPYEAAVAKAEASLATATTNADFAKIEMDRAATMIKTKAIAQRIQDERANAYRVALAAIKTAEAELKQAALNLEYAYVKAPISGRVGRVEITVGNLVQAGPNAPLMTRIISYDPIYADFEVDEQTYVQSIRNSANDRTSERKIPVELSLQGDKDYSYKGTIYTFDNRIDVGSSTIRARAKFENPDGLLVPGMFALVKLAESKDREVLLIPQNSIASDQNKKFVYVVDENNKVFYRDVELGSEIGFQRIVLKGLKKGDRVITKGLQHVKANELVDAKEMVPDDE